MVLEAFESVPKCTHQFHEAAAMLEVLNTSLYTPEIPPRASFVSVNGALDRDGAVMTILEHRSPVGLVSLY